MAVNITATRTSSLFNDLDGDGVFDPGDVVLTRIRITNLGTTDATGVSVTDTLNGVTLVAGSVQVTPIAFDDFMPSITGNTPITFTAAQLLGNDVDPDGAEIALTITGVSNAVNGAIVDNLDGTFTFTPTTGFAGTGLGGASFQYTISDEQGLGSVTTGIVRFDVTDPVWYVNNATGSDITGDGSWAKPFATLVPLSTGGTSDGLDNADDTIFVYNAGTYNSGIVLEAGQKLFGDGHAFVVNGLNIGANGSNTTINHAGVGVTLSTNNTIMGVTLNGTANAAVGVEDGGVAVGTFTMDESSIIGSGKAVDIDNGGTLAVDLDQMSSTSSTSEGIHLQGVTGTFAAATGHIQTSTGAAVVIGAADGLTASSGGDVNFSYGGDITNPVGSVVNIQDRTGGTVTFSGSLTEGGITLGTTAIVVDGSAGTINFNGQTSLAHAGPGAGGNGVSLTNNSGTINFNPIGTGLDISTTTGTGLVFTGGGTLNITGAANSVTTTTGQILNLSGTMGTSGIAFQTLTSGTVAAGNAININNLDAAGAGTFSGGAVTIGGTGGASTDGINITASNSTFGFASATIDNTQGDGIEINGTSPNLTGAVTFTTVNIDGVGGAGVNIVGATNAVSINGGTIGATNDPAGDGVNINGGTGAVTVAASVTKTTLGNEVVDISNHNTGAISFTGAIASNSGGGGIRIVNNAGGTIGFSGDVSLSTGTLAGLTFTNTGGTGATVSLTGGTTDITTTSGTGINATNSTVGAGSLTISGASNTVAASTGRAINVDGVTLNATLLSVGVSGGGTTTGIFLKDTGASGQFIVTGTGSTAGSGGTITNISGGDLGSNTAQATTGTAVYLNNVSNVSLSNMIFGQNAGTMTNYGIRGENVNNFTLRDSEFRGAFGTNDVQDESAIRFGTQGISTGLRGTALFEGNVIGGGHEDNLAVYVMGSNTLNMTVKDSASDQAVFNHNSTSFGNDSISLESGGTSNVTLTVTGVTFNGARGDQLGVSQINSTTQTLNITNNTFHNTHPNTVSGGGGVWLLGGDLNAGTFVTVNYTFSGNSIKNAQGDALRAIYTGHAGSISGLILNNTIGTNNGVFETNSNGGSVNGGSGIDVGFSRGTGSGNLTYAVRIEGNTVRDIQNAFGGIILTSSMQGVTGTARLEATVLNNTVQEVGGNVLAGLYAIVGGASSPANSQDASKLGLVATGNTFTAGATNGGSAIFFDQLSGAANYYFPGYTVNANSSHGEFRPSGGGGTASTSLDTFFDATNVLISGPFPAIAGSDVDANFTTGITNQAFVLAVPIMAAPPPAVGWEDLVVTPTGDPQDEGDDTGSGGDEAGDDTGSGGDEAGGGGDTGDSGGGDTGGGAGDPPPVVADDGLLTQAELGLMVEAAIQRWIEAGASAAQVDAMRAVQFGIVDMAGIYVGTSTHGVVNIDNDGAGYGWFVDVTPGEDGEFEGSGTRLTADVGGEAAGKLDLLTVLMHELGHQIGLGDEYQTGAVEDLMYGYINVGERRLPAEGEADGAVPGSVGATAFALTPVSVGTLPSNKTVDVYFKATINLQSDKSITHLNNDSTISGTNFSNVVANEQNVLDSLTLGNVVFLDANKNGVFDAGEGVTGVSVSLYADTNDSGGWDAGDMLLGTQSTLAGGLYSFVGLAPGDYIVVVNATNFNSGQALEGELSISGGTDPDDNIDNDDNGIAGVAGLGNGIASQTITLAYNSEPDGTPDVDGDADADTNLSLDFGFITPNAAPTSTNLDGDIATYVEGASPVKIDVGGNATLSDPTSADFAGGTLTVAIGTGADTAEDVLSIGTTATVTLDAGNTVKVGGTTIGTYAGGTNGNPLVITLNSSANAGNVDDLLRALQYNNTNLVDPSTDTRSVSITLVDGDGTDGGLGTDTLVLNTLVNVTGVNDAPSGAATGADATDDMTTLIFTETDFNTGFSDPDDNDFAGIVISNLPATGKLKLNNVDITDPATITLAQLTGGALTFVPDSGTGGTSVTFDFAVYDDGGVLNGGADTDPTPGTFTVTINTSTPSDPPVLDLNGADPDSNNTAAYTEQAAPVVLAPALTLTDSDDTHIESATISIGTGFQSGFDYLSDNGVTAAPGSNISASFNSMTGVMTLTGSATLAEYQAVLREIRFDSFSNNMGASKVINWTVNDGSTDSVNVTTTITLTGVNDRPVSMSLDGDTSSFTEGGAAVKIDVGSNALIGDADSPDFDTGSLTISLDNGVAGEDQLGIDQTGVVTISGTDVLVSGTIIGTLSQAGGAGGGPLKVDLNANATQVRVNELIRALTYFNSNTAAPDTIQRSITLTLVDGDGTALGGTDTMTNTLLVTVNGVDDAPVAQPDAISTPENAVGTGDLLANNGSGPDTDVDSGTITISAVNGSGANVDTEITLASGAKLTVNADGTYSYDPDGAFDWLTDNTSGAVNTSATDSFQYTVTGGNTVTVTVTVNGVAGPGDWLMGDGTDNTITGTPQNDLFLLQQGGDDTVYGLASDDIFYFGGTFDGDDTVDGGDGGKDVVVLQGNYTLTLSATNLTGVESLSLKSGAFTTYGDLANNFYDYDITTVDDNVASGGQLIVNGSSLRVGEDFTFDGSAEQDGKFLVFGGHGVDTLTGGDGNDIFVFEGTRWGAGDSVDGGDGRDAVVITAGNGLTHIEFGPTSLVGIESITVSNVYSSTPTATPDYEFVLDDGNVAAGETLIVNGFTLTDPNQTISIDGSDESDGKLVLIGGAGSDVLIGGDGADVLYGAGNNDTMTGGDGNDVFRYDNISDSIPADRDGIQDFTLGDLIDLSRIDADTTQAGDQAFNFIGSAAFGNIAGQLRYVNISAGGPIWAIQGDTDGINGADFEIVVVVTDLDPITSGDFIL